MTLRFEIDTSSTYKNMFYEEYIYDALEYFCKLGISMKISNPLHIITITLHLIQHCNHKT